MKSYKIIISFMLTILLFSITTFSFAAYTSPYNEPQTLIRYRSQGEGVKWVQDLLKQNGYTIGIDGYYGSQTQNAVKHFQKYNNLDSDGIVGLNTRTALKKSVGITSSSKPTTPSTNTSSNSSTTTSTTINAYRYTTTAVNFRNGPSTTYTSKEILAKGTKIYAYQKRSDGWVYVKYNNQYGYISSSYLTATAPTSNTNTAPTTLPTFTRNSSNLLEIIKKCKSYYANNNFYYSLASGVRTIPADQSKTYTGGKRYVDCSSYVTWVLYEYAKANGNTQMKNYFSYQRNSATFASIGANGGNNYLSIINGLTNARPGDILVTPGHVEFFSSYSKNSNGTCNIKVYNCGSDSSVKVDGISTSATKYESEITYILRVK